LISKTRTTKKEKKKNEKRKIIGDNVIFLFEKVLEKFTTHSKLQKAGKKRPECFLPSSKEEVQSIIINCDSPSGR